jgi:hypothetical protein
LHRNENFVLVWPACGGAGALRNQGRSPCLVSPKDEDTEQRGVLGFFRSLLLCVPGVLVVLTSSDFGFSFL